MFIQLRIMVEIHTGQRVGILSNEERCHKSEVRQGRTPAEERRHSETRPERCAAVPDEEEVM